MTIIKRRNPTWHILENHTEQISKTNRRTFIFDTRNCVQCRISDIRLVPSLVYWHYFHEHLKLKFKGEKCPWCEGPKDKSQSLTSHILDTHTISTKSNSNSSSDLETPYSDSNIDSDQDSYTYSDPNSDPDYEYEGPSEYMDSKYMEFEDDFFRD